MAQNGEEFPQNTHNIPYFSEMSEQLTIDFSEWTTPGSQRPHTPAGEDLRSVADRKSAEMIAANPDNEPICYLSFGSGSSGNSCYVGTRQGGIIVDAGVDADKIVSTLRVNGVSMSNVKGLCLTHDHSDHVRYAYKLLRQNKHIKLYCTNRVLNAILRRHNISSRIKDYHVAIFKEFPFKIGGFSITAFDVPHDAADNAGFCIEYGNRRFVIATDMGEISERARYYMTGAKFLMIEANYDFDMLRRGPYPEYLKARIRTGHGHMDNADTATFLADIADKGLRNIFLCHLSKDNNKPELALSIIQQALEERGLKVGDGSGSLEDRNSDISLMALPRFEPTPWMRLR